MIRSICRILPAIAAFAFAFPTHPGAAQAAKPQQNESKGQGQLVGANGQLGMVYTLQNSFNFAILSAKYTIEPFNSYELVTAATDQKLLVLDIAIKNVAKGDNFFSADGLFTLVDEKNQLIPGGSL